jgi:hypothetical protein
VQNAWENEGFGGVAFVKTKGFQYISLKKFSAASNRL